MTKKGYFDITYENSVQWCEKCQTNTLHTRRKDCNIALWTCRKEGHNTLSTPSEPSTQLTQIIIDEAIDTPLNSKPECLPTCGTLHRGCDPQCPVRWYEEGKKEVAIVLKNTLEDIGVWDV